jgi:hypothetical protein
MPDARPAETPPMAEETVKAPVVGERFWLALSDRQVQELVLQETLSHRAGRGLVGILLALSGAGKGTNLEELMRDERFHDRRISQSVIRSLLVLSAFALGEAHGLNSLAAEIGMGKTTLWRFLKTWVAVGLLEEREDRRYQVARPWRQELLPTAHQRSTSKTN